MYYNLYPTQQAHQPLPSPPPTWAPRQLTHFLFPKFAYCSLDSVPLPLLFPPPSIHSVLAQSISIPPGSGPVQPLLEDVSWLSPNFSVTPLTSKRISILSIHLSLLPVNQVMHYLCLNCKVLQGTDKATLDFLGDLSIGVEKHTTVTMALLIARSFETCRIKLTMTDISCTLANVRLALLMFYYWHF